MISSSGGIVSKAITSATLCLQVPITCNKLKVSVEIYALFSQPPEKLVITLHIVAGNLRGNCWAHDTRPEGSR